LFVVALLIWSPRHANSEPPPEAPPVSSYAPADLLVKQTQQIASELAEKVAGAEVYQSRQRTVKRLSSTLSVLALALEQHDRPHELKAAASGILHASQRLAAAKDFAAAKAAEAELQAALNSAGGGGTDDTPPAGWQKVAAMEPLMKEVAALKSKLRRGARGSRFKSRAAENAGHAAVMAVIGQAAIADTHAVKDPARLGEWYHLSAEMRDAAGAVSAGFQNKDLEATKAALKRLEKNCKQCHTAFRVKLDSP